MYLHRERCKGCDRGITGVLQRCVGGEWGVPEVLQGCYKRGYTRPSYCVMLRDVMCHCVAQCGAICVVNCVHALFFHPECNLRPA
jgi:hypothetical protein